jgi:hypothetical protein
MHVAERDSLLRQLHMAHLRGLLLRTLLPRREQAGAAVSAG